VPPGRHALARMDMVYATDGKLGVDRMFDSRTHIGGPASRYSLKFPGYWQGHVWLQPCGPHPTDTCLIELVWGPWKRHQRLRSGSIITTRKAVLNGPELVVQLPRGWRLMGGWQCGVRGSNPSAPLLGQAPLIQV
jgi:hypothetical protein